MSEKPPRLVKHAPAVGLRPTRAHFALFDETPFEVGQFRFMARGVKAVGKPSLDQWTAALDFASQTHECAPYWIGALLCYAENRADWQAKLDQAMSVTGLAKNTLEGFAYVYRRVAADERAIAPSPSHARAVAPLEPAEQRVWLEKAATEGLGSDELKRHIRASSRRRVIEGQAVLAGMYRVIYAAPDYDTLTMEAMAKLPVQAHALADAVLFLWVRATLILANPGPRDIIEAWGFTAKSGRVWDRVLGVGGLYTDLRHEHLIIATRGTCVPDDPAAVNSSILTERRDDTKAHKPASVRLDIMRQYTTGPYLELFARERFEGWDTYGDDASAWKEPGK